MSAGAGPWPVMRIQAGLQERGARLVLDVHLQDAARAASRPPWERVSAAEKECTRRELERIQTRVQACGIRAEYARAYGVHVRAH